MWCVAWDLWGFMKKDKDRAPVIQSCVYTEIHTILTLTSLWQWHAFYLKFPLLYYFRSQCYFLFCFVFSKFCYWDIILVYSPTNKKTHLWHDALVGDIYFHIYSGFHAALYHAAFTEKIPLLVFKANQKARKNIFFPSTFFHLEYEKLHNCWHLYLKSVPF